MITMPDNYVSWWSVRKMADRIQSREYLVEDDHILELKEFIDRMTPRQRRWFRKEVRLWLTPYGETLLFGDPGVRGWQATLPL
jgi:hypothetical protein